MTNKSLAILQIFSEDSHILDKSVFLLHVGDNYIGSGSICDILLPDSDIEEMAFKITISEDGADYGIEDIGSKLGLYKSGNDNTRQKLKPNKEYEFSSDKPIFIGNRYKCLLITKALVKKQNEKIDSSPAVDESQNSQAFTQSEYRSKDYLNSDNFQTQPLATLQQDMDELDNYHTGTPKAEKNAPLRPLVTASDFKNSLHDDGFEDEEAPMTQSQKRNGVQADAVKTEQATVASTRSFKTKTEKPETSSNKLKKGNSFNKKEDPPIEAEKPEPKIKKGNSIISKQEEPEEKPSKTLEKKKSKIPEPKESKPAQQPPEKEPKASLLALMGKNKLQDAQSDEEAAGTIEKAFDFDDDDITKGENSNYSSSRLNTTRSTARNGSEGLSKAKKEDQETSFTTKSFKKKGKEPEILDNNFSDQEEDQLSNDQELPYIPVISQDLRKKPTAASKTSQDVIKKNLPKNILQDDDEEEEENSLSLFKKRPVTRRGTNEEAELDKKMKKEDKTPTRAKPKEEEKIMEISMTKDEDTGKRTRGRKSKAESTFLDLDGLPFTKSKSKGAKEPKKSQRKATDEMEIEDKKGKSKKKNYDTDEEEDEESDHENRRKSKRSQKKKVDDDFEQEEEKPKKKGRKRKDSMEVEPKKAAGTKKKGKKEEEIDSLMERVSKMSGEINKNFFFKSESEQEDGDDEIRLTKAKAEPAARGRKAKNAKKEEEESDDEPRRKKEKKPTKITKKEEPEPKSKIAEKQEKKTRNKPKQVVSEDEESEEEPKPMEIEQTKSKAKKPLKSATPEKPEPKKRGRPSSAQKKQDDEEEEVIEKKLKTDTSKSKPKPAVPVRSTRRAKKDDDTSDIDVNLTKRNAYKVLFSGFDPSEDGKKLEDAKRKLKSIGVKVTEDKDNFNVLILGRYIRSVKFLLAVSRGISIVSLDWVLDCAENGKALSPDDYLIDDETTKSNFDFPLSKTLERVRRSDKDLLKDYTVWMPNNIKPSYDDLKSLIESMKGSVIRTKPGKFKENTLILLNEGDEKQADHFIDLGFKVHTTELIYSGILHQKLKLNQNLVK